MANIRSYFRNLKRRAGLVKSLGPAEESVPGTGKGRTGQTAEHQAFRRREIHVEAVSSRSSPASEQPAEDRLPTTSIVPKGVDSNPNGK
jgi:hypothetical protein